jgi:hypothetical protein
MEIKIEHGNEMVIKFVGRLDTVSSLELSKKIEEEEIKEELVAEEEEEDKEEVPLLQEEIEEEDLNK